MKLDLESPAVKGFQEPQHVLHPRQVDSPFLGQELDRPDPPDVLSE